MAYELMARAILREVINIELKARQQPKENHQAHRRDQLVATLKLALEEAFDNDSKYDQDNSSWCCWNANDLTHKAIVKIAAQLHFDAVNYETKYEIENTSTTCAPVSGKDTGIQFDLMTSLDHDFNTKLLAVHFPEGLFENKEKLKKQIRTALDPSQKAVVAAAAASPLNSVGSDGSAPSSPAPPERGTIGAIRMTRV
jgi:hypothetical protein